MKELMTRTPLTLKFRLYGLEDPSQGPGYLLTASGCRVGALIIIISTIFNHKEPPK